MSLGKCATLEHLIVLVSGATDLTAAGLGAGFLRHPPTRASVWSLTQLNQMMSGYHSYTSHALTLLG